MAKKLLRGLAPVLAVAALGMVPAVAQASPKFFINGKLAESKHESIVNFGKITLENHFLGKIKCENLASGNIWNESEKGLGNTEGYTTYGCTAEPTPCAGVFATAEQPVEVTERLIGSEKKKYAQRGKSDLPWTGEVVQEEAGEKLKKIKTNGIKVTIVMPCLNLEIPFEGALEPIATNGAKNGLNPSHLTFQGKGGKTGFLTTTKLGTAEENNIGYTIGEVVTVGPDVELINAE
jgi:hypothetical protein